VNTKRILIAAIHYPVASGRYIARAFKRLGHDVRTVGPATGNQIWGMTVDERHAWTPDARIPVVLEGDAVIGLYLDTLFEGWLPDLIVTADSGLNIAEVHSYRPIPHIVWGVDNHVRDYSMRKFDHYFLAHHDGPALPVDDSRADMTWLPCAYDPEYFTPSPIPMAEREYDVACIGVLYDRRVEILNAMHDAGLKVLAGAGLLYEDYRDVYHNARISLCVSAAGDVAQRVFETAAMGCLVLSDICSDYERLCFGKFEHYVPFASTKGAVAQAMTSVAEISLANEIRENSLAWATPHTWDARAQVVLDTMFGRGA
jgi:hypothetical protein